MRRRLRARQVRRLVLGRAPVAFVQDAVSAVKSSRRAVLAASAGGAGPTQTPVGGNGALGAAPLAAWAARTARHLSTPAAA